MFAYIDETGNSGAKMIDDDHPMFMTAALMTRSDFEARFRKDVDVIVKACGVDEIHATDMGVWRLEDIALDILAVLRKAGPTFAIARVEKRFVVSTKVFDTLFDSGENIAVPWNVYNDPTMRMVMMFKVASILDNAVCEEFISALMHKNAIAAQAKIADVCRTLNARVHKIPDARSQKILSEALEWASHNPEALSFIHSDKVGRKGHLPNMVGFGNLLAAIERQSALWGRQVDSIVHDRQHEFAPAIKFWHQMFSNARDDVVDHPFGGKMVLRKVFGSRLDISSAKDNVGVQVIDVILWLFARSMKEDLPPNCQKLLNYVHGRSHTDDFSFASAEAKTASMVHHAYTSPITSIDLQRAHILQAKIEQRRIANMAEYARNKAASE